jgi:hypothetical protein
MGRTWLRHRPLSPLGLVRVSCALLCQCQCGCSAPCLLMAYGISYAAIAHRPLSEKRL